MSSRASCCASSGPAWLRPRPPWLPCPTLKIRPRTPAARPVWPPSASARAAAPPAAPTLVAAAPARRAAPVYNAEDVAGLHADGTGSPGRERVAISQNSGDAVRLVGQLTFRNDPSQRYYLTNALKVVRVDEEENAEVVGRVTRTDSQAFPFVLTDGQQRRLFITARGDVYDKAGQHVAKLHDTM